jgi:hypothetical protein
VPVAKIAARVMAGEPLACFGLTEPQFQHVAVKEAVLPFARFPGSDLILGPEMKSTGESMGIDQDFATAYLKAQLGAGVHLPRSGSVLLRGKACMNGHTHQTVPAQFIEANGIRRPWLTNAVTAKRRALHGRYRADPLNGFRTLAKPSFRRPQISECQWTPGIGQRRP